MENTVNTSKLRASYGSLGNQNIAHELKTPVASIQGYLETILDNPHINEEMKSQFLQRCYAQSERLTSLLRDISTLNRLDDGSDMIDFEAVDITQMVREIARETALERESHQMTFENLLTFYFESFLLRVFQLVAYRYALTRPDEFPAIHPLRRCCSAR